MNHFLQKSSNLFAENRLLKFSMAMFGLATLSSGLLSWHAMKTHTVILVPPGGGATMSVSGGIADERYLRTVVRYVTSLGLTYTPVTARAQFDELLALFYPDFFAEGKNSLYGILGVVEASEVQSVFYIQKIVLNGSGGSMEVTGRKKQWTKNTLISDGIKTYIIGYRIENGRFWLTGFSEKVGA
jgi:conjugal transfer pilus assembly protein TraE